MVNRTARWLLFIELLFLSGCSFLPTNIVNEINMIQGVGYDLSGERNIKETIIFPIFKKDASPSAEVKTAIGQSSKGIRTIINNESRYPLVSGQLRLALYGDALAKKGINDIADTLNRDPAVGSLIQMAIVDGDASDLLMMKKYTNENISIHMQEMLNQNMESGLLPQTDLQSFLFQFFQIGMDPYLPLIKKEDDRIKIIGVAIFRDDKFVMSLSIEELFIFKGLVDKYTYGLHQFTLENGEQVVLDTLDSHAKYKVKIVQGRPEFNIQIKMKTRLQEFSSPKKQRVPIDKIEIQNQVEQYIEKNTLKIVNQFKSKQVDPLGLGAKYKEHYRGFNGKRWKQYYPHLKVHVKSEVEIKQTGIVD